MFNSTNNKSRFAKHISNEMSRINIRHMKKHTLFVFSLLIATAFTFTSCESEIKNTEKKEGAVKIGSIVKNSGTQLTISLEVAASLMQKHNRLTQEVFNYTYTRAWIETLITEENTPLYYLGVEATLEAKNNERAYSCYSVYSELTIDNDVLNFYPDAYQQACMGKCCGSCKLEMFEDNVQGCKFEPLPEGSECEGRGGCKHDESRILDKEQEKDDMI